MAPQREWFEKDYYAVLGVSPSASDKDIARAYRKLAKEYHPDARPGDKEAEERFKEVSAANDVLADPEKRKDYDEVREMVAHGMGPGSFVGPGGGFGGFEGATFDFGDAGGLGDLFGNLFGGGGRRRGRQAAGPQRGADLETELSLDFLDAVHGVTASVSVTSDAPCSRCGGSGAEPGTFPQVCPTCGGRGQVIEHKCKKCKGSGVERRRRTVKVRIPAGVRDGQRIRVKVPTLDGPVTVKVPPGTQSGKTVRVRGRGIKPARGEPGDLLVTFDVQVPSELSAEERAAVEALAQKLHENPREHLGV